MNITPLPILPRNWVDPILRASTARNLLTQPHHLLLGLGEKAEGGHLFARLVPGSPADLLTIFVRESHRRQGHARSLLNMLINAARDAGCPALTLEVRESNAAARALYESMGFTPIATRAAYYAEPAENGIVYSLNLG